ncbi:MAG: Holliday junction branch migration protein RuvA [Bacteroidota bacterium]
MIAFLRGTLLCADPTEATLDIHGVGFTVLIPLSTYRLLPAPGAAADLLTHLHVREDILQLYGFATEAEREMFRLLIGVSGIGPRMALVVLSGISATDLADCIATGRREPLTAIPGVGRKLAERITVELKDRVARMQADGKLAPSKPELRSPIRAEAVRALAALGFTRMVAEKAVLRALEEEAPASGSLEDLVRTALRLAAAPRT